MKQFSQVKINLKSERTVHERIDRFTDHMNAEHAEPYIAYPDYARMCINSHANLHANFACELSANATTPVISFFPSFYSNLQTLNQPCIGSSNANAGQDSTSGPIHGTHRHNRTYELPTLARRIGIVIVLLLLLRPSVRPVVRPSSPAVLLRHWSVLVCG